MKARHTLPVLAALALASCETMRSGHCPDCAPVVGAPQLFNGKDLSGWSLLLDEGEEVAETQNLAVVRDGAIHLYADTPDGSVAPMGNLVSGQSYSRYKLTFEYAWGGKRFSPRSQVPADSGLLYHIPDSPNFKGSWLDSVQVQIREGQTGQAFPINTGALCWTDIQPLGVATPDSPVGILPEFGGYPSSQTNVRDFVRGPQADSGKNSRKPDSSPVGWTQVEVIVQGGKWTVHKVNGVVQSRLFGLTDERGRPLTGGRLGFQLECAEVRYRNIRLEPLPVPLEVSSHYASLSSVKGVGDGLFHFTVSNPGPVPVGMATKVVGNDPDSFLIIGDPEAVLQPGERMTIQVVFKPHGPARRHSAGLQIGQEENGAFVILQGLALDGLEAANEPSLSSIVHALGIPAEVGASLSKMVERTDFAARLRIKPLVRAHDGAVQVTPVARFSKPGRAVVAWGGEKSGWTNLSAALASSEVNRDTHQCLLPSFENRLHTVSFEPGADGFELGVNPRSDCRVAYLPVSHFEGKSVAHALLACVDADGDGDYQDFVFLLENVRFCDFLQKQFPPDLPNPRFLSPKPRLRYLTLPPIDEP